MQNGGSAQQAPQFDAGATANAQKQANVETGIANAWLGNTNQVTPYGNLTYKQTGTQRVGNNDVPTFTATQTLSPEQQKIYDQTSALQDKALGVAGGLVGKVGSAVGQGLDFSGLPPMASDGQALRDQAYNALTARSNQALDLQQDQQKTQLYNQGIREGSQAWDNAMRPIQQSRVDASNQATIQAGNIAGQNLQQSQTLHNQALQEMLQQRNQPLQDYSTLLGFGGGVTSPTWATPTQASIPQTDVTSPAIAAYQGQIAAYNQGQAANGAMMGGLFGLGGSVLGGLARNIRLFGGQ